MSFGRCLERYINNSGKSISAVAKQAGLNRGGLYNVFKEARKIKSDDLFKIIRFIGLSPIEEKKLLDLYFSEYYGKRQYEKLLLVMESISNLKPLEKIAKEDIKPFTPHFLLQSEDELLSAIDYIINGDKAKPIITNYSFKQKKIDDLFYYSVESKTIEKFTHIVSIEKSSDEDVFSGVFSSLRFLFLRSFPQFTYLPAPRTGFVIYPYFVLGEKYAILFNDSDGIFIEDEKTVQTFRDKVASRKADCVQFGSVGEDVLESKDFVVKFMTNKEIRIFDNLPCVGVYQDLKMFRQLAKPDLENKDFLANVAHEHYRSLMSKCNAVDFITLKGLDTFITTGNVNEMPRELKRPLSKKEIYRALEKVYKAVEENRTYMIDEDKFNFSSHLVFELNCNSSIFFGGNSNDDDFMDDEIFVARVDDAAFAETMMLLADYLILSKAVYEKSIALSYIGNRMAGVKALIED